MPALDQALTRFAAAIEAQTVAMRDIARDQTQAQGGLARAVETSTRESQRTLSELTLALRAGLQMTTRLATASDVFVPFSDGSTITGTTALDVWNPGASKRFVMRGGYVVAIVSTVLAAANEITLNFIDSGSGKVIAPIGAAAAAGAAALIITGSTIGVLRLDLAEGVRGSVLGAKVQIKPSADISTGVITVSGIVWGVEEAR